MKKSLLALAVLGAFAGVAQAQTSVTIYGSFDAGVRSTESPVDGERTLTMGSAGTYNSNRLGFKGVEDLGGGMNAHFTLESGFNSGTGAQVGSALFNRSAFVGLGGTWGAIDLGRQYSVNFQTIGAYDPFNYKYTGIIPLANQGDLTRLNNDIKYTGAFGPVTVRAEYALGEVAGDTGAGATAAVGASFATGPFSVGAAYTTRANATDTADQKNWTLGGAFATGPFRIAAGYAQDERDAGFTAPVVTGLTGALAGDAEVRDAWLGGSYNITPAMALQAAWYQTKGEVAGVEGKRDLAIFGATYSLSKRTNFYADIDWAKYSDNFLAIPDGEKTTSFSVGINHLF